MGLLPNYQRNQVHARSIGTVSGHGAAAERFYDAVKKTLDVVKVGRSDRWLGLVTGLTRASGPGLSYHLQGPETG